MRIGIIGATGWLGSALGGRLLSSQVVDPQDLVLLNRSGARADYHGRRDIAWAADPQDLVARCDVVSVRPGTGQGCGCEPRGGWSCHSWPGSGSPPLPNAAAE